MEQQIFADGIGRISVIGGLVRLDLVTYSATETDANGQPRPILTHRIIMGADGFLRSSEKILEAVKMFNKSAAAAPAPGRPAPSPPGGPAPNAPSQTPAPNGAQPPAAPAQQAKPDNVSRPMPSPWSEPLTPKLPFP